jgi:hypothetical protein
VVKTDIDNIYKNVDSPLVNETADTV